MLSATALTAVTGSGSEVSLMWSLTGTTDTSVVVERAPGTGGTYQVLTTLPAESNTYTDVSCWAGKTYSYKVFTVASDGTNTTPTSPVSATTDAVQSGALNVVSNLHVVANSPSTATVTFTDTNASQTDLMYLVERSSNGMTYQLVGSIENATTFSDVGLTPGATYEYRVRAGRNGLPDSDYSAAVSVTMPTPAANLPKAPSGLTGTDLSATSVQVSWTNNDSNNPQFQVYRAPYVGNGQYSFSLIATTAAGATSYTDTGLTAENPYVYEVRAINGSGVSDFATPASDVMQALFGDAVGVVTSSAGTGSPKTYDIGPGYQYTTLGSFNWSQLGPGDTVNIHYKPGGYNEQLLIDTRGTPAAWITINGVPDPTTGALPILNGAGAVQAAQFQSHSSWLTGAGELIIGLSPGYVYGYTPGYLKIENLVITGAYSQNTFTDYTGTVQNYNVGAAGVYLEGGTDITLDNLTVYNNGEGIFGAGQAGLYRLLSNVTLESNYIYNNGEIGDALYHNSYLEGINTLYEYNHYGPTRTGALGAGIKDRGPGTVIKYNTIDGGAHQIDLPETENEQDLAMVLPEYNETYVFGNVIISTDGSSPIHYGGDQGLDEFERKGVLYLYDNTIVIESDQSSTYHMAVVDLVDGGQALDARNNIIAVFPATPGATPTQVGLIRSTNNAYFGTNWVSNGVTLTDNGLTLTGNVGGLSNLITGSGADPGFVDAAAGDFHLLASSAVLGLGGVLAGSTAAYPVAEEYQAPQSGQTRSSIADLGAFETAQFPFAGKYAVFTGNGSPTLASITQNGGTLTLNGSSITSATITDGTKILVNGTDPALYGNGSITFLSGTFAGQTWTKLTLPTDFTNPAGARVHIFQNGSALTFSDRNGKTSPGTWVSPTQLFGYGETVTIGSGPFSGQLIWDDGTIWSAVVHLTGTNNGSGVTTIAAVPSKVLVTDYLTGSGLTVHTVQTGTTNIVFVGSTGVMVLGTYSNPNTNVPQATAPNYPGYTASIVGNTITWTNGKPADTVVWTKTTVPAASISVTDYTNQNGVPVHLVTNGTNMFVIVDGLGNTSLGHFLTATTGVADAYPTDIATFSGSKVFWSDGIFVWTQTANPPLLITATDQNNAISHLAFQSATILIGLDGPLKGVTGTRVNDEIEWTNGAVWVNLGYDLLSALFELGTGFP
ncbi:MAG: fibronectin type III domain-containing protein [Planctomycetia bacterium]|nr:fibronectin type III domain-containing protein [Planctomycetia bacterium]